MRIMKMELENFKGIRSFTFEPNGASVSVYGGNGTGKTTLYDAFCYLMFGRPSTDEKSFSPIPQGLPEAERGTVRASAELVAEIRHREIASFKKVCCEKGTKSRKDGTVTWSETTEHFIDGIPVSAKVYEGRVSEICDAKAAQMLTKPEYFCEDMPAQERRAVIIGMGGDLPDEEAMAEGSGLERLKEFLAKPNGGSYTPDEYRKVAEAKVKAFEKEKAGIAPAIAEAMRSKPDAEGTREEKEALAASLQAEKEELERQRLALGGTAGANARKKMAELEAKRAEARAAYVSGWRREEEIHAAKLREMEAGIGALKSRIVDAAIECDIMKKNADAMEAEREYLFAEWKRESEAAWGGDAACPTCGQELPPEKVEGLKAEFNRKKSERLEGIKQKGLRVSADRIDGARQDIAAAEKRIEGMNAEKAGLEESLAGAKAGWQPPKPFEETEEGREIGEQIADLAAALQDAEGQAEAQGRELSDKIAEADAKLKAAQQDLFNLGMAEKLDARIRELSDREGELSRQIEECSLGLDLCRRLANRKAQMLEGRINSRFKTVSFQLFEEARSTHEMKEICEAMVPCAGGPVKYRSANHAAKVNAGLEVIGALSGFYGKHMPIFIDNAESIVELKDTDTQVIRLVVSGADKALRMERDG